MLGRKIAGRAHDFADGGHAGAAGLARDAEIGEQHPPGLLLDQNIARRYIAVDDAVSVGVVQRDAGVAKNAHGQVER